jgi:hypothetical protein
VLERWHEPSSILIGAPRGIRKCGPPLSVDTALLSLWSCISQELPNCWWREQTCIVAVLGLVEWRNVILVSDVIQSLVSCWSGLLLYTWYVTQWDIDRLLIGLQLSSATCLFYRTSVKFPRRYGGESYTDKAGVLESLLVRSEAWRCVATTGDCLVLSSGAHRVRNSYKLRCHVFCSWGWVTDSVCVWIGNVCVCHNQPTQQQVDVYAHFQFLQPLYSC